MEKIFDFSGSQKFYGNGLHINTNGYEFAISLLQERLSPDSSYTDSKAIAELSMSPQLAKSLYTLLGTLITDYENNIGIIPEVK